MPPTPRPSSDNTVWIERSNNRIHARIPYWSGSGPEYAKSIAGSNWSSSIRMWTYPLDMQVCRDFRDAFGPKLEIGPELWSWAAEAAAHERSMGSLARATDATLSRVGEVAPTLAAAIATRTYQRVGAQFIARGGSVLIADQPGLGKTLETLAGLVELNAETVIVFAPKTAIESVWAREITRWIPDAHVFTCSGTRSKREKTICDYFAALANNVSGMKFLICNTEMVRYKAMHECQENKCNGNDRNCSALASHIHWEEQLYPMLFGHEWDAIVCDESHMALLGRKTQTRKGFVDLSSKYRIAISGTPYRGKLENFWGLLNWLNPSTFTSYWKWIGSYFEVTDGFFGGKEIGSLMPHRKDAYDRMVAPYVLRRTKAEVAADLPPKMYAGTPLDPSRPNDFVGIWLEMSTAQARCYREMEREARAIIDGGELTAIGILAELIRLKQFSACSWKMQPNEESPIPSLPSNKFDWLLEFMEERKGTGAKVVVASQYTSIINLFCAEMEKNGHNSYVLTGETKQAKRAEIISRFQDPNDPVQLFFINTKAGGVAVTLDQADELVFIDETYIPDDQEQVEDRIHRVSRNHNVTIYYLRSLGTVDETICSITDAREAVVKGRLDGARGIEMARKLLGGE